MWVENTRLLPLRKLHYCDTDLPPSSNSYTQLPGTGEKVLITSGVLPVEGRVSKTGVEQRHWVTLKSTLCALACFGERGFASGGRVGGWGAGSSVGRVVEGGRQWVEGERAVVRG